MTPITRITPVRSATRLWAGTPTIVGMRQQAGAPGIRRLRFCGTVAVLVLGLLASSCSSDTRRAAPQVSPTPAVPAVTSAEVRSLSVALPFSADRGALIVTPGSAPAGFTSAQAAQLVGSVFTNTFGTSLGNPLPPHQLLAGEVTLSGHTGVAPLAKTPAWVFIYQPPAAYTCISVGPVTSRTPPSTASGLTAIILTEPYASDAVTYSGAGTGPCGPYSLEPTAEAGPTTR